MEIRYENNKLILPSLQCDCGMPHTLPDMDIYIGNGILQNGAEYIKQRGFGVNCLLVADNNTYKIVGQEVERLFRQAGFQVTVCLLEREDELEPDETAVGEVLFAFDQKVDFLAAVGSGSINDITRCVAFSTGRPFVSVATAASMDGYTSVVCPMLNKGLKVTRPGTYPKVLICDLDVIKSAPYKMTLSGFGDVIGKYIPKADWILGRIINGEKYCPLAMEISSQAVQKCIDNIDGIRNHTDDGIRSLIEALILTGLTILMIGNTRPVASTEHNMAHFWEMRKLIGKEKAPSHGTAVGVATGYAIKFFEIFLTLDLKMVDQTKIKKNKPTKSEWEKAIIEAYGDKNGHSVLRDNPTEYIEWSEQERRIDAIVKNVELIRKELAFLPKWDEVMEIYRRLGFPPAARDVQIDEELLISSLMYAKDYRIRYSVFKSANELGMLEEIVEKIKY
jgi:glycerol-1-phosphate dehydrogenase [NAD(P)+]